MKSMEYEQDSNCIQLILSTWFNKNELENQDEYLHLLQIVPVT